MALEKIIDTPYGVDAKYWRIMRREEMFDDREVLYVGGYVSKAKRNNGAQPLMILPYTHTSAESTRAVLYAWLKTSMPVVDETGVTVESNLLVDAIDV
jgi:hypothetical protein